MRYFTITLILLCSASFCTAEDFSLNKMKRLIVKSVTPKSELPQHDEIIALFNENHVNFNEIDIVNWSNYPYKPSVKFRIAYSKDEIFIQYIVNESCIRAHYINDEGSRPFTDSCVEFFSIPGEDSVYYNLEMNCLGVGTFAGGAKRTERTRFGSDVLSQIRRYSSLPKEVISSKEGNFEWSLTIALPIKLFSLSKVEPLKGRIIKANFYKCGDELLQRHYLSWNPIPIEKPNFHTPDYFGELLFD